MFNVFSGHAIRSVSCGYQSTCLSE